MFWIQLLEINANFDNFLMKFWALMATLWILLLVLFFFCQCYFNKLSVLNRKYKILSFCSEHWDSKVYNKVFRKKNPQKIEMWVFFSTLPCFANNLFVWGHVFMWLNTFLWYRTLVHYNFPNKQANCFSLYPQKLSMSSTENTTNPH